MKPRLYMIIPCYNEEKVLPITSEMFLEELNLLITKDKISENSRILFVNDGSKDKTWDLIKELSEKDEHFIGICQSRNRGHQNAVLAGMMEAKDVADITISIDCDGQDDIAAMEAMVDRYHEGCEIVYGVRSNRDTDTFFKRFTAQTFYKLLNKLGGEIVYNHADYRLVSARVLKEFANFKEVNLFLRGMIPLVGFKSTSVYYERHERLAGESHYPLSKMLALAFDGITSDYRVWTWSFCLEFYRNYLGGYCNNFRKNRSRMVQYGVYRVLYGRNTVDLSRCFGRIHRKNLYGGKSKTSIYYQ